MSRGEILARRRHRDSSESESVDVLLGEEDGVVGDAPSSLQAVNVDDTSLQALHANDDPAANPWTFRMFVIGLGLSCFGSVLSTIFLFKPQTVLVSVVFLTVISYIVGNAMSIYIPSTGKAGKWLNPQEFNSKEHLAIVVMASSASATALATEVLASQKLYYGGMPNALVAIMLLLSSQLLGYGMAGILRSSLVYPTRMLWPAVLPLNSLIQTLHQKKEETSFKFFWVVFFLTAIWELLPQYTMPILTGISIFCLAKRDSLLFTNLFGGTSGNEGLGLLSLCFDFQYITTEPLFLPAVTLVNSFIGFLGCIAIFISLYYGNIWRAQDFPFLSQQLFSQNSTSTTYIAYNQSSVLNEKNQLDTSLLEKAGLPFYTATFAAYLFTASLSVTATFTHVLLFEPNAIRDVLELFNFGEFIKRSFNRYFALASSPSETSETIDPHYHQMLNYAEVPLRWYTLLGGLSAVVGLACIYSIESTLPWWSFILACIMSFFSTTFLGTISGLFGFNIPITSVVQLIGGYLHPGRPLANMYFVLFGANSPTQAIFMIQNLKFGQYGKLSPRCTFTVQVLGTILGAIVNFFLMDSITTHQRDNLLSIQGTNVWSGQEIQSFNSNAIAFGAFPSYLFSPGRIYAPVVYALPLGLLLPLPFYFLHRYWPTWGFDYIITPVLAWHLGYLAAGINSSSTAYYALGFFFQFYVRKRYPAWFVKYRYILAAAISGGAELLVFITTFTVQGATGREIPFWPYWGNNYNTGNFDYCAINPASSG